MFTQQVFANTMSTSSLNSIFTNLAPLLLISAIFYFLVIRPQQTKLREHQKRLGQLKKGDKILTSGGIIATVFKIESESEILLAEISKDVKVKVKKGTISQIID